MNEPKIKVEFTPDQAQRFLQCCDIAMRQQGLNSARGIMELFDIIEAGQIRAAEEQNSIKES